MTAATDRGILHIETPQNDLWILLLVIFTWNIFEIASQSGHSFFNLRFES